MTMYRVINEVLQPYTLLVLAASAALVWLWRKQGDNRRRLLWLIVPFGLLVIMSVPAVSDLAIGSLEWQFTPLTRLPDGTEALVVLSGALHPVDAFHPQPQLAADTLYRCQHAAELYRKGGPCLVIVTGGVVEPENDAPPLAALMRDYLIELGVSPDDLLAEDRSTSTYENAVECHKILQRRKIERITLVTNANHMLRAAACFRRLGLEVTPAPCEFLSTEFEWRPRTFLPSPGAARGIQEVWHEWLGIAWYWLHGRI
ncbi:MAG TPA: YdcF family protein [Pirellulales bacterium]|nr:YdcF family protein [Pirellulales bacterium]